MDERELKRDVTKDVKVWYDKVKIVRSKVWTLSSAMK